MLVQSGMYSILPACLPAWCLLPVCWSAPTICCMHLLCSQVVAWRSALLKLAEDGAAALPTIRQALLDDATDADKLDVVFEAPDLGRLLLSHAAALPADQVGAATG